MTKWVQWQGREVSLSTKWWAEHNPATVDTLYCKHGVSLTEACKECR